MIRSGRRTANGRLGLKTRAAAVDNGQVGHGGAGRSAGDRSARLRAEAERKLRLAEAYDRGRVGEEHTEVLLQALPDGFRALHDRAIPGSRANIDHIVIGPTGVFVIDSKNYSGRISVGKGTVWSGRQPLTKKLQTTAWEAQQIEAVVVAGSPTSRKAM